MTAGMQYGVDQFLKVDWLLQDWTVLKLRIDLLSMAGGHKDKGDTSRLKRSRDRVDRLAIQVDVEHSAVNFALIQQLQRVGDGMGRADDHGPKSVSKAARSSAMMASSSTSKTRRPERGCIADA
jgi:hypothetical protein